MSFNTTPRRTFNAKQRVAFFEKHRGICYLCGGKIHGATEAWEIEHVIAREIMGDGADEDENLALAHKKCHAAKTREDRKTIAKSNAVRARALGAHRPKQKIPSRPFGGFAPRVRDIWEDLEGGE